MIHAEISVRSKCDNCMTMHCRARQRDDTATGKVLQIASFLFVGFGAKTEANGLRYRKGGTFV